MTTPMTVTLAVCLAGGTAFGIALARPAGERASPVPPAPAPVDGSSPAPLPTGPVAAPVGDSAPSVELRIADFAFSPTSVAPGQSVTVTNADGAPHTATAIDGSFDTGTLDGGASVIFTAPAAPGVYPFFCAIHPSMTGDLVVG